MGFSSFDERAMSRAIALATRAQGRVSPNPLVGAVVVSGDRILGEGYHRAYGGAHAETEAIRAALAADESGVVGATLYCNLEPCCYRSPEKHQPPCVDLILGSRLSRVVVANLDPNPRVNGRGVELLRSAGIAVEVGLLADRGEDLNEVFFHSQRAGRPFVHLKAAQSLDGRVATATGDSKWITDERARRVVHRLRAHHDAVLVGAGTVSADDPELTVRLCRGRDPLRVVLSSRLDLDPGAKLLSPSMAPSLIVFCRDDPELHPRAEKLRSRGAQVFPVPEAAGGGLDLGAVLDRLYALSVRSVLVEGGGQVLTSFVKAGFFQKVSLFTAPLFIGEGRPTVGDLGLRVLSGARRLRRVKYRRIGDQILVTAYREDLRVHGHR